MEAERTGPPPDGADVPGTSWWASLFPLWVAMLSLMGAVAMLLALGTTTRTVRAEIAEVVEPARSHLYDVQRILALEDAAQRGYLLTRTEDFIEEYRARRVQEDVAFGKLRPLVYRLGPEAVEQYGILLSRVERWREMAFQTSLVDASPRSPEVAQELEVQQAAFAHVFQAATALEDAIQLVAEERRQRLEELEQREVAIILLLVLVAAGSVLVIVRASRRMRSLALHAQWLASEEEERRRELERTARDKEQFIQGVTHDLKNPLGVVDAYAHLLEAGIRGDVTPGQLDFLSRIRSATRETLRTIEDLLELARAEGGHLRLQPQSSNVWEVAASVAEDYRASIEASGHTLRVETPEALPSIATDPARVREILANLLSNANKYTPAGGTITVGGAFRSGEPPDATARVAIWVRDTGPGISPEEQERVFEAFHRAEGAPSTGSGVGLAISRRMAHVLGGELTLESRPGVGSCFVLWLPVDPGSPLLPAEGAAVRA